MFGMDGASEIRNGYPGQMTYCARGGQPLRSIYRQILCLLMAIPVTPSALDAQEADVRLGQRPEPIS